MGELFDDIVKTFEDEGGSCDMTLRTLTLGSRDSETGWRAKSYSETNIKMIVTPRGTTSLNVVAGSFVRLDALGKTDSPVKAADEIKTKGGTYYEVKAVHEYYVTPDTVEYYECDLTKLPLHG